MRSREETLRTIANNSYDVCVIGGGATGAGCALDAQLRGLKTVLVEAGDFAGATSSKATKIIHGGVRYLEEAVKELDPAEYHVVNRALRERILMLKNGPYLSRTMEFLIPCFHWLDAGYYDVGLKLYDWIAGDSSIFPSHFLSRQETLRRMPTLKTEELVGAIAYADGQFNDARYNVALVKTFWECGGDAANYLRVTSFEKTSAGKLVAAQVEDQISHQKFVVRARVFVNSTGPVADVVRGLATPGIPHRMRLSKGSHILLPLEILPSEDALLIPKTEDGRVLFAVPWMGRLLVGTTETEVGVHDELLLTKAEVDFILRQLNKYLEEPVSASQIVGGFAGARPLVSRGNGDTKKLSRDDELEIDVKSGLISIMGGKWTTHRAMAEDTIDAVQKSLGVPVSPTLTRNRPLTGSSGFTPVYWMAMKKNYAIPEATAQHLAERYGTNAPDVLELAKKNPELAKPIIEGLAPIRAEIVYSACELALTIEDVLARRIGLEFFSWRASRQAAPVVGAILGPRLGWSAEQTHTAVREYQAKIDKYLRVAGLAPEAHANHNPVV
ncbi:MAG TPA: FAD-dependent oxidoreductase [Candidatus Acidoferrum sp.]|nr:FAD-dependent oxidoreductase [Candidatus Acidoferrum sp.]